MEELLKLKNTFNGKDETDDYFEFRVFRNYGSMYYEGPYILELSKYQAEQLRDFLIGHYPVEDTK